MLVEQTDNAGELLLTGTAKVAREIEALPMEKLPTAINQLTLIMKSLEATMDFAKNMLKEHIVANGADVPETKSKDWNGFRVRPHRTTLDPKKLEALLRAKKLDVNAIMDKEVKYKANEKRAAEVLSESELNACRYDLTWVLDLNNKEQTND